MAIDRSLSLLVKFAAIDKLTGKMQSIGGSAKKTAADIAGTRREIDRLQKAQAKIGGYRDAETRLRATSTALEEQRQKLALLRAERDRGEGSVKKLDRAIGAAERKEAKLIAQHEKHGSELQQLSSKLEAAGIDVADLARHEDRLGHELYETNKRLQQQRQELEKNGRAQARVDKWSQRGSAMQGAGAGMVAGGAAIGAPLIFNAKKAIGFEAAMADVRKAVDGMEDPKAFKAMNRSILQLSREVPIAAEGLAQIVASGGQAGIAANELLPFARNAAQMGVAFEITADQAGDLMAKWRTAFRMSQQDVVTLADKVNYLSDRTAAAPDEIGAILTRVGPLAGVAGLAAGEVAALGATLTSMGVGQEIAATGIKNTMLALTKGEAATKNQQKAYAALGLESTQVAKSMQRDATGTIMMVMEKIGQLPDYQQASLLDQLFGSESIGAIAPLLTQLPTLEANLRMVGEGGGYAGSMMREFETRNGTVGAGIERSNNSFNAMRIILGEALFPTIRRGSEILGSVADSMSAFADEHPQLAAGVTLLTGALAGFLTIFGTAALVIGTVAGPIAKGTMLLMKLGPVLSFLISPLRLLAHVALWGLGALAAFLGMPVWLVGAIAIGIGVAAALIWKHWDKIKSLFMQGVTWLKGLTPSFSSIGKFMLQGLLTGLNPALLAAHVLKLGSMAVAALKKLLGIKSPSRVFMGLGGFMTEGLAVGIDRGASEPLGRMRRLAGQMSTALAIGAASTSPAAASPSAGAGRAGLVQHVTVNITIAAHRGQDASELARAVAEEIERQTRNAANSSYQDDD